VKRCQTGVLFCTLIFGAVSGSRDLTAQAVPERLVAEAPIWGQDNDRQGYAFLPVRLNGHAATLILNLNCTECDLSLSTTALSKIGVTLADPFAIILDSLTIGTDVQRHIPLQTITKLNWFASGPDTLPPVVGIAGVHFLTTRYDLLYDSPHRRVRLYALPPKYPVAPAHAWLPPGFTPTDCGRMVNVPPGASTFTGVEMQLDGHPVTGVLEMGPYQEKMNAAALHAMGLTEDSARVQPIPAGTLPRGYSHKGHLITKQVPNVHMTIGHTTFWTGPVQIFPELDAESLLTPTTPVMLLNLSTIHEVMLFNAVSSGQVCVSRPRPN
jgi:hypothetical protein